MSIPPYAAELKVATELGILPDAGGLGDQESRFVDALLVVLNAKDAMLEATIRKRKGRW